MRTLPLLVVVSVVAGVVAAACSSVSGSYSRRDIVDAVRIVSAQRGDGTNWAADLPIKDKSYSPGEASAAVRTALRDRWCKSGSAPTATSAVDAAALSAARENPNAAQLAASTPDIRC
jgi:hypothetical protein